MRPRSLIAAGLGLLLVAIGGSSSAATTTTTSTADLATVSAASVAQTGRELSWSVTLAHGFSRGQIASQRRTVCLLLQRRTTAAVVDQVCLAAAGSGRGLGLTVQTTNHAGASLIRRLPGTVTQTGSSGVTVAFTPTAVGLPYRSLRWQVQSTAIGRGCPLAPGTSSHPLVRTCDALFPATRHPLLTLHTPRLVGCVAAGPPIVYSGPHQREIALTFDDGPWPEPPSIDFVNELKRLGVVGTFFEIGDQISEYDPTGSVQRAMLADGDMIGNHTWTHPDMLNLSPAAQTSELQLTDDAIRHATGFTPCLWRPPYGAVDPALESLTRRLDLLTIDWDIDPRDWSLPGTTSIVDTVLQEAQDGGIVEMHFGGGPRFETLQALPQIVHDLRARGYRFVNLVQMLGLREIWR